MVSSSVKMPLRRDSSDVLAGGEFRGADDVSVEEGFHRVHEAGEALLMTVDHPDAGAAFRAPVEILQ